MPPTKALPRFLKKGWTYEEYERQRNCGPPIDNLGYFVVVEFPGAPLRGRPSQPGAKHHSLATTSGYRQASPLALLVPADFICGSDWLLRRPVLIHCWLGREAPWLFAHALAYPTHWRVARP